MQQQYADQGVASRFAGLVHGVGSKQSSRSFYCERFSFVKQIR
jgi:hypothetical protein